MPSAHLQPRGLVPIQISPCICVSLEMDQADYYLRYQTMEEEKRKKVAEIMMELLVEAMEVTKEKFLTEIDEILRVHTRYAINRFPREGMLDSPRK